MHKNIVHHHKAGIKQLGRVCIRGFPLCLSADSRLGEDLRLEQTDTDGRTMGVHAEG